MDGYIYVRVHSLYEHTCKLGKTINIPERDAQYATGELHRGQFALVFAVPIFKLDKIERALQREFFQLNIKYDGGTEFYDRKIMGLIEPYFIEHGIKYNKLSHQDIDKLKRQYRERTTVETFAPRDYQNEIIDKTVNYLRDNDKGILLLICGIGKTLISLWTVQRMGINTILVGVPNKLLLKQWKDVVGIIFRDIPCLIVSGGVDVDHITNFIDDNIGGFIVITTYSSAHKVYKSSRTFGVIINDECHHLTSANNVIDDKAKKYISILGINSDKRLSLTATPKHIESSNILPDSSNISNNNTEYFGDVIDRKCLLWAINHNIICDYVVQTIVCDDSLNNKLLRFGITDTDENKRLFLGAFVSLKSISEKHSHHLLIYSNSKQSSLKLIQYINMMMRHNMFDIPGLYYSNYHSDMLSSNQRAIIEQFSDSSCGIISNVYCLGEGWDFPSLDAVVFSENMSSNIRIVQSALRASRKDKHQPNKITKIILPILNDVSSSNVLLDDDNTDLKKVREVIYQMSLEDETIIQKIRVSRINMKSHKSGSNENDGLGEYDEELTNKLRLKTTERISIKITYEKARNIIKLKKLMSKEEYYELCLKDIRLPKEPETVFKSQFTNWIDYLGIDRVYYGFDECKDKIVKYMREYPELRAIINLSSICERLCEIDKLFPPKGLWIDYYNIVDLNPIFVIQNRRKKR
jgi:predicted helicase